MTIGRGSFGPLNLGLLLAAGAGAGLFVFAGKKVASPLIQLTMFRDPRLSASLVISALVMTVMMATLVVGPFYLSRTLHLDAARVGLVMSIGPILSAPVSYTHLRAHETVLALVCRLLLEKENTTSTRTPARRTVPLLHFQLDHAVLA